MIYMMYLSNVKQSKCTRTALPKAPRGLITLISHQITDWTDEPVVELLLVVRGKKSFHFNSRVKTLCLWTHAVYALIQKKQMSHLEGEGRANLLHTFLKFRPRIIFPR